MSGTNKDNTRAEEFKRATAGVLRAMADIPDVQVAFQPGPSGLSGKRARLPLPTRALPPAEMARLRGSSDAIALRLRHHDDAVHAARMPARREAKDVYDALEQARVEVVGSRHMSGVAANLQSKLAEECEAEGYDRMTRKDQLPIAAALALLAREQMSGEPSPPAARRILDMWRDTLGETADAALAEMNRTQDDQLAYARAARRLLAALDLAEAESEADPEDQTEEGEDGGEQSGRAGRTAGRLGAERGRPGQHARCQPRGDGRRGGGRRGHRIRGRRRGRRGRRPARRPAAAARAAEPGQRGRLPRLHAPARRGDRRRGAVRPRRTDAAAPAARSAAAASAGRDLQACQPAAAPPAGAADACLGVRPGRGPAGRRAAVARGGEPDAGAVLQARARHGVPRHGGDAADRQLRARCADGRSPLRRCAATSWRARWSAAR